MKYATIDAAVRLWRLSLLTAAAIAGLPAPAAAQLDCVVKTVEQVGTGPQVGSAALAPFRNRALEAEAIVKRTEPFMRGVRPVRVRTTHSFSEGPPRGVIIDTGAYNEGAWVKGRCDVIGAADRGGGIKDGAVHLTINIASSFMGAGDNDGVSVTYEEPKQTGTVRGYPEYDGMYILLSRDNRVPWVPVTAAEALDKEERLLNKKRAEWERDKQRPWLDPAKLQASYEAMKKLNPEAAEKQREAFLKLIEDEKRVRPQQEAQGDAMHAGHLAKLREQRAAMTPAQLQAQARVGYQGANGLRVDDPKGRALVKVDPRLLTLDPNRIHFIRVFVGGVAADPVPGRYDWTRQTLAALDLDALHALVGK